jgi:RND family efflux transporter MFP subunit
MKALTEKIVHYLTLIVVTAAAFWVMWKVSSKDENSAADERTPLRTMSPVVAAKALVKIEPLQVQMCEIYSTFSGKIRAWETYQIGFETPGRVKTLGQNSAGQPLDEGDLVTQNQILAVLDERVYEAQKAEAAARLDQASADVRRAERVRLTNPTAVTDAELQQLTTEEALARARLEVAVKHLEDATLRAPVAATISKRMIKSGESVSAHQRVFELVQNDEVLLVVDVPESQIRELESRMRVVEKNIAGTDPDADPDDRAFRAHVHLEGRDRFGNSWPPLLGEVFHIAEVSDPVTGLFEVEIRLANDERLLRPGMVATVDLVTARIAGYRVPEEAVIYRDRRAYLFTVDSEPIDLEMLYWNVGSTDLYRARQVDLRQWIDQGSHVIVPGEDVELETVVVRGHFRLGDGQVVRVKNLPKQSPGQAQAANPREGGESSLDR